MKKVLRIWFQWQRKLLLFFLLLISSVLAFLLSSSLLHPKMSVANSDLLAPAPKQPLGSYDYFGKLLSPQAAAQLVQAKGLNPYNPLSYGQIGAVRITQQLIDRGELIFLNRKIGDDFGLQQVFGFQAGIARILPELTTAILQLRGQPTSNLQITLQKDIQLGSRKFSRGMILPTGLDVEPRGLFPVGLLPTGGVTCAVCHVAISPSGQKLKGVPNGDLAIPFLIALAPNSAAGFARLKFNPLDRQFQGNGKTILDSRGNLVRLPDPKKFEDAFDDAVLDVPFGNFESSPDGISNTTQIPHVFTFKAGPYTSGGEFAVGPFAGLSVQASSVHSSEINLLAADQLSAETLGIDPEVYLGTILQNSTDPRFRLPGGDPVKPSAWLRQVAPNPTQAELEDQIPAPGAGSYPRLQPSLSTYNGLFFSPNTFKLDLASGPFLFASNAMAAWQNSLVSPPNRSPENQLGLQTGSVQRGAQVFRQANCATCHIPPYFTDNKIHPIREIKTNPARAESRLAIDTLLVPPKLYSLNTPVPIPGNAKVIDVPTAGISKSPTSLPIGILPEGGYKTPSLSGLFLTAPYLHDGGVAVRQGALAPGTAIVANPSGLGLAGTLSQGIPADAANSLRALLDRQLRSQVIAVNKSFAPLVRSNLDGTGHEFYVDGTTGFTPDQQTDLINFLLALDDNPSRF